MARCIWRPLHACCWQRCGWRPLPKAATLHGREVGPRDCTAAAHQLLADAAAQQRLRGWAPCHRTCVQADLKWHTCQADLLAKLQLPAAQLLPSRCAASPPSAGSHAGIPGPAATGGRTPPQGWAGPTHLQAASSTGSAHAHRRGCSMARTTAPLTVLVVGTLLRALRGRRRLRDIWGLHDQGGVLRARVARAMLSCKPHGRLPDAIAQL